MDRHSFKIEADEFEPPDESDMGEGCLVLSQPNERGKAERVAVRWDQLIAVLAALEPRYGEAKNTDALQPVI